MAVKVPCLTPHSLQHGVRTVEFQTPVYERLIVYFAQKVLTQNHWDTDQAISLMQVETPPAEPAPVLQKNDTVTVTRIVDFEDFEVHRVSLQPNKSWCLDRLENYVLLMTVDNGLQLDDNDLHAEQAMLVPASAVNLIMKNTTADAERHFLLAYPKNSAISKS